MFQCAVANNGDGEALVADETRLTYQQLDDVVSRLANGLSALGLIKGDRVALLIGNRAEFVYVLLAALRIGAIAVPINIREQTPELTYVLNHCGARLLVHDKSVSARLPLCADTPVLEHRYCTDGEDRDSRAFSKLLERSNPTSPRPRLAEEDVAVILYTSGTTGLPKGAMLTHLNIIHSVMHFALCMELRSGHHERSLLAVPASHVTGLVANLLTMLYVAGCNVILETFDTRVFLELAARERITHTIVVPAMYNLCLLRADFDEFDLNAWRIGGYGGAPMPESTIAALARKLPSLTLVNAYGSTEASSPATMMPLGLGASHADSVGICLPCGDIRIVDEAGHSVETGADGEIWIAGPMVVPGYWDNEDKTRESFELGYWKSGDIGSRDADGFIRLHDRKKDMIIRGGYNVYSAEIENVLSAHPDVIECAAIGQPDPVLGEKTRVHVYADAPTLNADSLKSFCAERLADYKVPDFITFTSEPLPRNANGKLLKKALRERS
ncbi:MAG: acyl--CoA ligase [Hyphomicrobiales bacterium]|nr:acyl--CoA ligase [Hyphomicrobiales bacterium]